ncbi:MAG: prolipoprotein diacylglyceryl transferase [Bacteroidales bacterium]|nr:prolipoprotein diacylglyceryl transferase [Bacteroidales bacterium]
MYPTVSDMLRDWFGVDIPLPIQSYGLLVALAFIVGSFILMLEFKRKGKQGLLPKIEKKTLVGLPASSKELFIAGIIGFVIGYKLLEAIINYDDLVKDPQGFILSLGHGNFIGGLLGAALSVFMKYREKQKQKLDKPKNVIQEFQVYQLTPNFLIVAAIFGLLGTKIFGHLETWEEFVRDPIGQLFSFDNLAFYGGLVIGGYALLVYGKRNSVKPLYMLDAGAPAVALAYGVGRIGCQVSGDGCWGIVNTSPKPGWLDWIPDWLWAFDYPHNVNNEGIPIHSCGGTHCNVLEQPVFPTPLYETIMMVVIFTFLWSIRKRISIPGMLFSIFMVLQGFERFLIEKIRVNIEYNLFGMSITQAEIVSFLSIIIGIVGIFYFYKNRERLKNYKNTNSWI